MVSALDCNTIYPRDQIIIREVGFRDGLQLVKSFPTSEAKQRWIEADYAAGLRHFEVGTYLPVARFPQFADVDVLVEKVASLPGAYSSVLAFNKKGVLRALEGGGTEIGCGISASEEHNLRNTRRTREAGLHEVAELIALRDGSEHKPIVTAGIAMSFGCSVAGDVQMSEVLRLIDALMDIGVDVIALADTVGYGGPAQVRQLVRAVSKIIGDTPLILHLHDTRGLGIANVAAALDEGVRIFDASTGGLGGCTFAPNASGNVVLDDVVFLAQSMGFNVPIDIEKLAVSRQILASEIPQEQLYGQIAKAGLPLGRLV